VHVSQVRRLRVRDELESTRLETFVFRTIGYRAECGCGWLGHRLPTFANARAEGNWHARGANDLEHSGDAHAQAVASRHPSPSQ
jgi:hypothetical protein